MKPSGRHCNIILVAYLGDTIVPYFSVQAVALRLLLWECYRQQLVSVSFSDADLGAVSPISAPCPFLTLMIPSSWTYNILMAPHWMTDPFCGTLTVGFVFVKKAITARELQWYSLPSWTVYE